MKRDKRSSGILLHISSLPSRFGIGDLGPCAYQFIDFLAASKQTKWQILPLSPTQPYASPYTPFSAFAGNPNYISPELLVRAGLITDDDLKSAPSKSLLAWKENLTKMAWQNFENHPITALEERYRHFCVQNVSWLSDYALFTVLRAQHNYQPWTDWPTNLARRETKTLDIWRKKLKRQIKQEMFAQFLFADQWQQLRAFAQQKKVTIIGDLPIFVAHNSADVWAKPDLFRLFPDGTPSVVAGVPPDYFSKTGQRWGNPLYDWQQHRQQNFHWWVERITTLLKFVDHIRIDHFRGFESCWTIPAAQNTAITGRWEPSPGSELFCVLKHHIPNLPFIAEDLGFIDEKVIALRDEWGLPGMRVLQFAFSSLQSNVHSPHNHTQKSVVYTGTHDNDTTLGWYHSAHSEIKDYTRRYLAVNGSNIAWDFIRTALASTANTAIIPLQDVLALGSEARMNTPGTVTNNWSWRYDSLALSRQISDHLGELTVLYGRD